MCNLYRLGERDIQLFSEYNSWNPPDIHEELATDLYPKRKGVVARIDAEGKRVMDVMNWGVPRTMPGKRPGTTITKHVTNVRNLTSPFWRSMLKEPSRRCLVPFSQFAEPKPGKDPETGRPAEHWFTINERPVAAFAGIWRPSEAGNVFAFLTCEPNPLVAPLHPKAMPVVLQSEDYDVWLTGEHPNVCALAAPYPSQLMAVA